MRRFYAFVFIFGARYALEFLSILQDYTEIINNKDIKELDGNIRVKALSPNESKIGVFIHNFELSSNFLNLFGW